MSFFAGHSSHPTFGYENLLDGPSQYRHRRLED